MDRFRKIIQQMNELDEVEVDKSLIEDCLAGRMNIDPSLMLAQFKYCIRVNDTENAQKLLTLLKNTVDDLTISRLEESYGIRRFQQ